MNNATIEHWIITTRDLYKIFADIDENMGMDEIRISAKSFDIPQDIVKKMLTEAHNYYIENALRNI